MSQEARLGFLKQVKNVVTFTLHRCPKCGYPAIVPNAEPVGDADPGAHCEHCAWSSPKSPSTGVASSLSFSLGVAAAILILPMILFHVPEYPLLAFTVVYVTSAIAVLMAFLTLVLPYPLNTEEPFSIVTCIIEGLFILSEISVTIYVIYLALGGTAQ